MKLIFPALILAFTLAFASPEANGATITINGSSFTDGLNMQVIGGVTWTSTPGNFKKKSAGGFTGVGITGGRTGDEIDIGEFLTGVFSVPVYIKSFTLGVLFDGPEFGDWEEVAQVTVWTNGSPSPVTFTLTNTWDANPLINDSAVWTGIGAVSNLSPSENGFGAVWKVTNPFGYAWDVTRIEFTALTATGCGAHGQGCNNQSDFTVVGLQYAPVPEPGTYALLATGLLALGWQARRRSRR